jgi:hypothetical protein
MWLPILGAAAASGVLFALLGGHEGVGNGSGVLLSFTPAG